MLWNGAVGRVNEDLVGAEFGNSSGRTQSADPVVNKTVGNNSRGQG